MGSVPLFSRQVAAAVSLGPNRDKEMAQLFQTQAVKTTKMRVVSSAQCNALTWITDHNSNGEYCLPFIDLSSTITLFTYLLVLKLW